MINRAILLGRLGQNPKESKSGKCAFCSIATTSYYNKEYITDWHNIVCFSYAKNHLLKYGAKGSLVYVEGEIRYSEYEGKQSTSILAQKLVVLNKDKKKEEDRLGYTTSSSDNITFDDDDIPF